MIAIGSALDERGVEATITGWIYGKLINRTRGCPQGGVLSPFLCSLLKYVLLGALNRIEVELQACEVDISARTASERLGSSILQRTLDDVRRWCQSEQISVNPNHVLDRRLPWNTDLERILYRPKFFLGLVGGSVENFGACGSNIFTGYK